MESSNTEQPSSHHLSRLEWGIIGLAIITGIITLVLTSTLDPYTRVYYVNDATFWQEVRSDMKF
jgi:hypothetical protein